MIFIDSDIAISWIHNKISLDQIQKVIPRDESIAIASPTLFELYNGYFIMINSKKEKKSSNFSEQEKKSIEILENALKIVPFNGQAAKLTAKIFQDLISLGEKIDLFDCMIAAIVLSQKNAKLLTNNVKHFNRIKDLQIISLKKEV